MTEGVILSNSGYPHQYLPLPQSTEKILSGVECSDDLIFQSLVRFSQTGDVADREFSIDGVEVKLPDCSSGFINADVKVENPLSL